MQRVQKQQRRYDFSPFLFSLSFLSLFFSLSVEGSFTRVYGKYLKKNARSPYPEFRSAPRVRVLIERGQRGVSITGTDLKRKFHLNNRVNVFKGRKVVRFNCKSLKKAKFSRPVLLASLGTSTGFITFENEKFHGLLHVLSSRDSESCDIVHETDIETYIAGLLSREMNASWPLEALKAQAVAARSYALHKMRTGQVSREAGHEVYYDLESSEKHQVSGSFQDVKKSTRRAALLTSGMVLLNEKGNISPIFFHAKCGGKTLLPRDVWQNRVKSYKSVKCPYCHNHGEKGYQTYLSMGEMRKFFLWLKKKKRLSPLMRKRISEAGEGEIRIVRDGKFRRKLNLYLGDQLLTLKKTFFRRYFGRFKFPSHNFKVTLIGRGKRRFLRVLGEGRGHGVGMCQLGALDLAQRGWDYKRILAHYFPRHHLKKVY